MIFSENIYFLILFTLPATLNIIYNAHIRHTPVAKPDKSVELAECVAFCFAGKASIVSSATKQNCITVGISCF